MASRQQMKLNVGGVGPQSFRKFLHSSQGIELIFISRNVQDRRVHLVIHLFPIARHAAADSNHAANPAWIRARESVVQSNRLGEAEQHCLLGAEAESLA